MKQHLTDDETVGFWMPGPPDEQTFVRILNHAQQCVACRDRLWAGMQKLQSLTDGLAKVLHKTIETEISTAEIKSVRDQIGSLLNSAMQTGMSGIAKGMGLPLEIAEKFTPSEYQSALDVLSAALGRIRKQPDRTEWSAADLFGSDKYECVAHFARCQDCFHRMTFLHGVARAMAAGAKRMNAPESELVAIGKLVSWFDAMLERVQKLRVTKPANPFTGGADQVQSMCN